MSDFIDFLFKSVPWLRPTLAWTIAFLLVFLILSVPAYFIFWPFLERARAQLLAFIRGLAERLKDASRERAERLNSAADEFLKDGGLWRLNAEGAGHWSALGERLVGVLKKLRTPVGKAAISLDQVSKSMSSLQEELRRSDIATLDGLPALPAYDEVVESAGALRVALLKLILSGMILLGLIVCQHRHAEPDTARSWCGSGSDDVRGPAAGLRFRVYPHAGGSGAWRGSCSNAQRQSGEDFDLPFHHDDVRNNPWVR